jgi:hypothetical protein
VGFVRLKEVILPSVDWMALWAVLIALAVSFGEMLSKYESKVIRDIFNRYLLIYLGINGVFAFGAYYFLPSIAQFFLKPEQTTWVQGQSWGRVFFAAFGYMVLVRSKVFTIKDTPIGLDTLYNTFASYCLRHTNTLIQNRQSEELDEVYKRYSELLRYKIALDDRLNNAPENERETIRLQRDTILSSGRLAVHVKCKRLGELLLQIVGTRAEVEKALASVPAGALSNEAAPPGNPPQQ